MSTRKSHNHSQTPEKLEQYAAGLRNLRALLQCEGRLRKETTQEPSWAPGDRVEVVPGVYPISQRWDHNRFSPGEYPYTFRDARFATVNAVDGRVSIDIDGGPDIFYLDPIHLQRIEA